MAMNQTQRKNLARIIRRAMESKGYSARDVGRESEKGSPARKSRISYSYVYRILGGTVENLSTAKIAVLGEVLDIDTGPLYEAVHSPADASTKKTDRLPKKSDLNFILDLMKKVFATPSLMALLEEMVHMSPEAHAAMLPLARRLHQGSHKARRKSQRSSPSKTDRM